MDLLTIREQQFMNVIWSSKEDISMLQLTKKMENETGIVFHRNTISTFIEQLVSKGYISTYHNGRERYIHSLYSIEEIIEKQIRYISDLCFDGDILLVKKIVNSIPEQKMN